MNNCNFYVYILLDTRKPGRYSYDGLNFSLLYEPFYIGKGSGNRVNAHFQNSNLKMRSKKSSKIKAILNSNLIVLTDIVFESLNEKTALDREIEIVKLIGRSIYGGTLTNDTDAGEGTSGHIHTEETKLKISKSHIGIGHTEETKEKLRIKHTGKILSEETKEKMSKSLTGDKNPFYGKKHKIDTFNKFKRPVYQIDIETHEILNRFDSISDAAEKTNSNENHIRSCCIGKRNKHNGFKWSDAEPYVNSRPLSKRNSTYKRKVIQLNLNGEFLNEFESIAMSVKETGLRKSNIIRCLSGKRRSAGGFKWKYSDENIL